MTTPHTPRRHAVRHAWTPEQDAALRERFPTTASAALAMELGVSCTQLNGRATKLGLRKSKAYLSKMSRAKILGVTTRFKPGHTPFNKGIKGWKAGGRSADTQFKKGAHPHSWKPIGSERMSKEGYLQRKLTDTGYPPRDWVPVHHIIWRAAGFDIPKGYRLVFKNGDKTRIEIDNLELVSIADLLRRNSYHNYGKDIARLVQLRGAITRQIHRREKSCQI